MDQSGKVGRLQLSVRCDRTRPGEGLAVAGAPPLPGWRGDKLEMRCLGENGENYWPVWKLCEPLEVEVGQEIEYKYVLVRGTKRDKLKWEADGLGNHRRLRITEDLLRAGGWDDGEFGDLPGGRREREARRAEAPEKVRATADTMAQPDAETGEDQEYQEMRLPAGRLRQVGKGKQGSCFLVDTDQGQAVLKEIKGRHAFSAEAWALQKLKDTDSAKQRAIPTFLGADRGKRRVLMSYAPGVKLPDADLAPAVASQLLRAVGCWLQVARAVEEANRNGVFHCDVNPWNVLCSEDPEGQGCLVDWACSTAGRAPKLSRRGDFQAAELMEGVVGPQTDVYGCAATMLWLLVKRTRKGLPERSAESLMALFGSDPAEPLARLCVWGMEEKLEDRCPTLSPLCDLAVSAQRLAKRERVLAKDGSKEWAQVGSRLSERALQASCFASLFALHGLAEIADRHDQESSVSETESSVSTTW